MKNINFDKNFEEFFKVIKNDSKEWNKNAHSGFDENIIFNLFKLLGKEKFFNKKYGNYLTDELIIKCREMLIKRSKYKSHLETYDNYIKAYNNLKDLINSKKILDLFASK